MEENKTVNEQETPKTFTQDEVNQIVQERLIRDRKDRADYDELKAKAQRLDEIEEANKTELEKANERADKLEAELSAMIRTNEIESIRKEVEAETTVPASLLTGETKEACLEQAAKIMEFHNSKKDTSGYPSLNGGEPTKTIKPSTNQQFAEWFEAQFK